MKRMTAAQANRQESRNRKTGKYSKFNPCELCGKSAGYNYCSLPWLDTPPFYGKGICMCEKCCAKLEAAGKDEAAKALGITEGGK